MWTLEIPAKMIPRRISYSLGIEDSKAINQQKLKELMFDSSRIKCQCLSWQTSYFIGQSPQDIITVVETNVCKQKKRNLWNNIYEVSFLFRTYSVHRQLKYKNGIITFSDWLYRGCWKCTELVLTRLGQYRSGWN